jgi:uncharacterized protein YidB (DUF937 family)
MGLLDGLLGGIVGAEMATAVNGFIQQHGGVQGVIAQLEQQGLGGVASPQDLSQKLSQVLPAAIDKLTPGGTIPPKGA